VLIVAAPAASLLASRQKEQQMNNGIQGRAGLLAWARASWRAWTVLWLLACVGPSHAADPPYTWEPFGYALDYDMADVDRGVWPGLTTFSSAAPEVCGAARREYSWVGSKYCAAAGSAPDNEWDGPLCRRRALSCESPIVMDDFDGAIHPVCRDYPRTAGWPIGAVARISREPFAAGSSSGTCTCPAGSRPDFPSGACVRPRKIELKASRTRYSKKEADKPVDLWVRVHEGGSTGIAGQRVTLTVTPNEGTPGTLSVAKGITDAAGRFASAYRFPARFDKAQIDTIKAECSSCDQPAMVEVKMAPVVVGFFNGVWNTRAQAGDGLKELKNLTGPTYNDMPLRYENFYNQSGKSNGNTSLQDLAETFIQRSNELDGVLANRWEHYWDLLAGRQGDPNSLTGSLLIGLRQGGAALADLIDAAANSMLAGFVKGLSQLLSDPPTAADMAAQLAKLQVLADEGSDFVLVAHSQGNLFVNLAYDGLLASRPDTKAKVVHVAPASPTTRGEYVLADIDQVINGLRNFGSNSVQPINLWLPWSKADASGHTLVSTYLDTTRAARDRVKSMIVAALSTL
jgi:hypothetical protein